MLKRVASSGFDNNCSQVDFGIFAKPKRAQVTIFIILAIIIVGAILVFFLWVKPNYVTPEGGQLGFEGCVEDVIKESVAKLGMQGGFSEPEFAYDYKTNKVAYLCYTNLYYRPCVRQVAFLSPHFENELEKDTKDKIQSCYESSVNELKSRGFDVVKSDGELKIELGIKKMEVLFNAPTSVSSSGSSSSFKEFEIQMYSEMYDLLLVSNSIVESEINSGTVDAGLIGLYHPDLVVTKIREEDKTIIYNLKTTNTGEEFKFAVRSYAYPAGYSGGDEFLSGV